MPTLCYPKDYSTPGSSVLQYLLEFAQIRVPWVSDAIQPSHPLSFASPPALNLSQHQVFSSQPVLHIRWPKDWSCFSISPSNEYSGLISFRIDWFDLLAVQGTLKSVLQHHKMKASVLRCSAFFMVQLSHPYMTTGETTALTIPIFVGKVMSLLYNILSRFDIAFLPRSKHLLISRQLIQWMSVSHSVMFDSAASWLEPDRLLCPWDSPGKNVGMGCPSLFQEILLIQGSNPGLLVQ